MSDILALKNGRRYQEEDVRRVVSNSDKQRFALVEAPEAPELRIRANQGHTIQVHTHAPNILY